MGIGERSRPCLVSYSQAPLSRGLRQGERRTATTRCRDVGRLEGAIHVRSEDVKILEVNDLPILPSVTQNDGDLDVTFAAELIKIRRTHGSELGKLGIVSYVREITVMTVDLVVLRPALPRAQKEVLLRREGLRSLCWHVFEVTLGRSGQLPRAERRNASQEVKTFVARQTRDFICRHELAT